MFLSAWAGNVSIKPADPDSLMKRLVVLSSQIQEKNYDRLGTVNDRAWMMVGCLMELTPTIPA